MNSKQRPHRGASAGRELGRWWTAAALVLVIGVVAAIWLATRKEYPEVTSPESLTLVRALYTACSSQNPVRLDKVEQLLDECCRTSRVTAAEERSFRAIITDAKANRWEEAQAASYRFAQDQVR